MENIKLNYSYIGIPFLFLASQTNPDNKLIILSVFGAIISFAILFIKYFQSNSFISKTYRYIFCSAFFLIVFLLNQNYLSNFAFISQFFRIIYPWVLTCIFIYLINPFKNNKSKLFNIINYSTLVLYMIILPDILSIIIGSLQSIKTIFFLKGFTIIYPESNTTAFLLFFNLIFRTEIGLVNKREFTISSFLIFYTISRSTILILIIYLFFKFFIRLVKAKYKTYLSLLISRTLPFLSIFTIFIIRLISSDVARERWQWGLSDSSFQSRLFILDYVKYVFENLSFSNFHRILLGFGWEGKDQFAEGVLGTSGHTLIGMIPELGLIYILFLMFFFYRSAWNGQIAESFILSLSLTIFIPISYVMPIFCLKLAKDRLLLLYREEKKMEQTPSELI